MSQKNADHFGNSADVVRTVLRVLGSWDNSKLVKYAIIPAFESPELYKTMNTDTLNKVCEYLHVQPSEIMEWIPDEEYNKANEEKQAIEAQIAELQAKLKTM